MLMEEADSVLTLGLLTSEIRLQLSELKLGRSYFAYKFIRFFSLILIVFILKISCYFKH